MIFDDLLLTAKKIFGRPVLGTRGPSVLGIDVGASTLKVVQAYKKGGKAVLETYGAIALGPYGGSEVGQAVKLAPEQTVSALKDLFREANVTTSECAIAIPLSASLVTLMQLPEVGASELELQTMIPIEARKYIPVPLTEVSLDWMVIPEEEESAGVPERREEGDERGLLVEADGGVPEAHAGPYRERGIRGRMSVLVIAIHNEALALFRRLASAAALRVLFVEVEIFSAVRSVLRQGMDTALVVDIGARTTHLYLVERGMVRSTHTASRGSQHITAALARSLGIPLSEAEQLKRSGGLKEQMGTRELSELVPAQVDLLFAEVRQVLLAYQQRAGKVVTRAVFIGGGALLPGLLERAREALAADVSLGNPFQKFEAPAFLESVLAEAGPEFSVAAGLALRALAEQ